MKFADSYFSDFVDIILSNSFLPTIVIEHMIVYIASKF